MNNSKYNHHIPVLLNECIASLDIKPNGIYIDCTFGRGGHSRAILSKLGEFGKLIAIDCDLEAINYAKENIKDNRFQIIHSNFSQLENILRMQNINKVDGFLFDLGVSSPQLDDLTRGFSYHGNNRLDMRMDQRLTISAYDIVNTYSLEELTKIFYNFAQTKFAKQVATNIIKARLIKPIEFSNELVQIIKNSLPKKELFKSKHPAKIFFQALRIVVNDEFENIKKALTTATRYLNLNGRLVIISFHSLENKIVKQSIKNLIAKKNNLSYLPIANDKSEFKIIKAPLLSTQELEKNKRSHSARLNIIERIKYE